MISIQKDRRFFSSLSLILSFVSAAAMGMFLVWYKQAYNCRWEQVRKNALDQTLDASKELGGFMEMLKPIVQSIADELNKKELTAQQIEELLRSKKIDDITSVGIAFSPYALDKNINLFGRAVIEKNGKIELAKLEDLYDYTKDAWFNDPFKKGAGFLDPYHNEEIGTTVAEYSVPIYRTDADGKKIPIGVVFANQSLDHLEHIIEELFLGKNGYWFILTEKGSFLAYPQLKYKSKTIFDIAADIHNQGLADAAKKIMKGESVLFEYKNEITGAPSWLISNTIHGTPWNIVGVFDQGELDLDTNLFRHKLIVPSILFLLCIVLLIISTMLSQRKRMQAHWVLAMAAFSCAILIQIAWLWYAIYTYPYQLNEPNVYRVEDSVQLYKYLEENFPSQDPAIKKMDIKQSLLKMNSYKEYVPMGVYINNMQFSEA